MMKNAPGLIPLKTYETDKSLVLSLPDPHYKHHFVVIPKKDIRNPADITAEDTPYLLDVFAVIGHLVNDNKLTKYKVITNGPGYQTVTYLHFHLVAN